MTGTRNKMRKYPAEMPGFWVNRLGFAFRMTVEERVKQLGLGFSDAVVLTMLRFKGSTSLVELSCHMGLTHPSVLRHVDALEKRGLLERAPHPSDRRMKVLSLTETGLELEERINGLLADINDQATSGFSEDEIATLFRLTQRAILNLGGEKFMPPREVWPPEGGK